jgi:hypothetical protein
MIEADGSFNHFLAPGGGFRAPDETGQGMADVGVRGLDGEGQILAVKMPLFRQQPEEPAPLVGDEPA